jgi:YD repeat-containing protein
MMGGNAADDTTPTAVDQRKERVELDKVGNVVKRFIDYGGDGAVGEILEEECAYDGFGRQVSCKKSVTGQVTNRAYEAQGRVAAEETLDGTTAPISRVRYEYDAASGLLAKSTNLLTGGEATQQSLMKTMTSTVTGPTGRMQVTKLDGAGRTMGTFAGISGSGLYSAMIYDADGNLVSTSTGSTPGNAASHFGTSADQLTKDYSGTAPWRLYNYAGQVVRERRPELNVDATHLSMRDYLPSGFGSPSYSIDEVGNGAWQSYDATGGVITVREDGIDGVSRYTRSSVNRALRTEISLRLGLERKVGSGPVVASKDQATVITRDRFGRIISEKRYSNLIVGSLQAPGVADLLTSLANLEGQGAVSLISTTTYDALGRIVSVLRPDGSTIRNEYFADNAIQVNDRRELAKIYIKESGSDERLLRELSNYNRFGRPERLVETQQGDLAKVTLTQRCGTTVGPNFGHMVQESTQIAKADGTIESGILSVAMSYDVSGKRTSVTYPSGSQLTFGYTDDHYLTSATRLSEEKTVSVFTTLLDPEYRLPLTQARWGGKIAQTFSFGPWKQAGLLAEIQSTFGSTTKTTTSALYDQRGLVTAAGQWPTTQKYTREYAYDGFSRYQGSAPGVGDPFGSESHQLDNQDGRTTSVVDGTTLTYSAGPTQTYLLTTADRPGFFDQDGTATVPKLIGADTQALFDYNPRGILTKDRLFAYSWDVMNREVSAETHAQGGLWQVSYRYDSLGRRVQRTERAPRCLVWVHKLALV